MNLEKITTYLQTGLDDNLFTSGFLYIEKNEEVLFQKGIGFFPESKIRIDEKSRFDLASLTKVVAVLPVILSLIDAKYIRLDDKVGKFFPELPHLSHISVKDLLTHSSGLPSHKRFYEMGEQDLIKALGSLRTDGNDTNKVNYSDLNFMILGAIIEKVTQEPLNEYCKRTVFAPLEMKKTAFDATKAVPTRVKDLVDDKNARFFKKAIGHAGLFSSTEDLVKYLKFWKLAVQDKNSIYYQAVQNQTNQENPRGFGWVLPRNDFSFHDDFSSQTFSHTGYSGTSIMVDPEEDCTVVFLTNRTYCGIDERFSTFRKKLHQLIALEMIYN